ncbi:hypothetical protein [Azospirillum sp. sgz302134]
MADVTVQALPERLQDLARAVLLTGTVAGETPEGLTRIRTQAGEILLQTPTPLPTDKPVTLQITPGQGQDQGVKVTLLLQGVTTTPAQAGGATAAQAGAGAGAGAGPAVILPNPTLLTATTAPATPAAQPLPQPIPLLLPGTIVPALVIAAAPKAPAPPGASPTLPGQTAQPAATAPSPVPSLAAEPGATVPTPSSANAPASAPATPIPAGASPASPTPAAPPQAAPPTAGTAPPAGKPMLDTPVQLGGDAAHPGAEGPPPSPTSATMPAPTSAPEPELPQGGTVALKILTITPPPNQPEPNQPDKAVPDNPSPRNPAPKNPDPAPAGGDDAKAAPKPSAPDTDRSPDQTASESPDLPDAPVLRGTVAGRTPQGQPILATKQGMLALNVQAQLPQGAIVTAALTDPAEAMKAAAHPAPELGPMTPRDWPAMRQLLTSLAGVDRAAAQTVLSTIMPQPNRKLGAALSFFLSAIRGGDARAWLGEEATAALEKAGRGDLLQQLDREFKTLQQQAAEPLPGDWRPYTLPMMDANGPNPIQLFIHPIKDDEEEGGAKGKRGGKGSRFLLDLDLSRLGPMQLDGLVQPNRFDLILRSHTPLAPELRLDLIQIFADSVRAVGYVGGLSFQSGAKCWVKLTRAGAGSQSYTA